MNRRDLLAGMSASVFTSLLSGCRAPEALGTKPIGTKSTLPIKGYIRTNWSRDPFTHGSYSYIAKDSGIPDLIALGAPIGDSVHFAGEAVNPDYQSTIHAAFESGETAAKQILATGRKSIGIIGAGTAGLAAARKLHTAGLNVTVFEARDRVGGRVWTDRSLGPALEIGGAFIVGTNGNPIQSLAEESSAQQTRFLLEEPGSSIYIGEKRKKLNRLFLPTWLESFTYSNAMGTDIENVNFAHLTKNAEGYFGNYGEQNVALATGIDQVLEPLQTGYQIELSAIVSGVNHSKKGAEIALSDGSSNSFDTVLITVPLGVLQAGDISFNPVLSQAKVDALARMGMGTVDKLFLQFEESFWHDAHWIVIPPLITDFLSRGLRCLQ